VSFTEPTGPPATAKQLAYLEALLRRAGYTSYTDARRPLGLTARQGRGKFTVPEASALIDRLADGEDTGSDADRTDRGDPTPPAPPRPPLSELASDALAAELRSRGWRVEPPTP
jgi:hypothetical protein